MLLRMLRRTWHSSTLINVRATPTSVAVATNMKHTAYVRYKPDADNLTISLVLGGRQRNLNRPVAEPLEKPISRIKASLAPTKADKRAKKKKLNAAEAQQQQQQHQNDLFVGLYRDAAATELIDLSTPNSRAWPAAAVLKVSSSSSGGGSGSDQLFEIIVNPPTVESLNVPGFPMVGYPILPILNLAFADLGSCRFRWLRQNIGQQQQQQQPQRQQDSAAAAVAGGSWEDTGCYELCYIPADRDLGCRMRVECTPGATAAAAAAVTSDNGSGHVAGAVPAAALQNGPTTAVAAAAAAAAAVCSNPVYGNTVTAATGVVQQGPVQSAARIRQLCPGVALPESWRFRVMSYNILADQYAGTEYAQKVLFKYCPEELLDNNYRRQLVLEEILRYKPDICCLQEVDDKVYSEYLQPHLLRHGFNGHFTNKQGKVREGSAMFWKSDKWAAAAVQDIKLRDVFKLPLSDRHSQFSPMLKSSPALIEALQKVTTIAQMVLLLPRHAAAAASSSDIGITAAAAAGPLLVINTHLFFHPYAPHIRSLHTAAILEEAAAALQAWQQQAQQQQQHNPAAARSDPDADPALLRQLVDLPDPTVLFCGDLNSDLNDGVPGVIEMLQTGQLAADHWDWQMGATFRWGKEEEDYAQDEQQQQQQQKGTEQQQQQQQKGTEQQQQQQQKGTEQKQQQQQQQQKGTEQQQQQQEGTEQQQGSEQQQDGTSAAAATSAAALQDSPTAAAAAAAGHDNPQQQQQSLEDGHDFDPGSSPRSVMMLHGVDVTVPFVLRSADDLATPYTNYTSGYKALLDYVWYDPQRLHVTRQLPVPAEQLLSSFIPSASFPSDHLAVVYDLAFKPRSHQNLDPAAAAAAIQTDLDPAPRSHKTLDAAGSASGIRSEINQPVISNSADLDQAGLRHHDSDSFLLLPATEDHVSDAVMALRNNNVIALPTDTLYGFAAAAGSDAAVRQLRSIKGRSAAAPLAVAVADVADVARYCVTDHLPDGLLRALLPGPVTVLLPLNPGSDLAPAVLNPDNRYGQISGDPAAAAAAAAVVGIRVVPNEFVRRVCCALGGGIVLTSANISGKESSIQIQDFRELWQYCGAVFDSGPIPVANNLGSTVIDLTQVGAQQQQQGGGLGTQQQQQHGDGLPAAAAAVGGFRIVRAGVAAESVADLLTKAFGLQQL